MQFVKREESVVSFPATDMTEQVMSVLVMRGRLSGDRSFGHLFVGKLEVKRFLRLQ